MKDGKKILFIYLFILKNGLPSIWKEDTATRKREESSCPYNNIWKLPYKRGNKREIGRRRFFKGEAARIGFLGGMVLRRSRKGEGRTGSMNAHLIGSRAIGRGDRAVFTQRSNFEW